MADGYGKLPMAFEPSAGSTDFVARGDGYLVMTGAAAATLWLKNAEVAKTDGDSRLADAAPSRPAYSAVRMRLVGGDRSAAVIGDGTLPGHVNYFIGNDPSAWRTNVATFARVHYASVWPGIDVAYYGNQRQLEFDFVLSPGADPSLIRLAFDGASDLTVLNTGELRVGVGEGAVTVRQPAVYQDVDGARHELSAAYVLDGDVVSLRVDAYDSSHALLIDPVISYSTYLGGLNADTLGGIAVDGAGQAYLVGSTQSNPFPTTSGAYDTTAPSASATNDVFLTVLNASGTALVYSTYLGGSNADFGNAVALDPGGNVYLTGRTASSDFPTTTGAFATAAHGGFDGFVTKLTTGGTLGYSTLLGGQLDDTANSIAVGADGTAYVIGTTSSSDFPTSVLGNSYGGGLADAFVTRLNASGSSPLYSRYLGGSGPPVADTKQRFGDLGKGIALDASGNAYVTGWTDSQNFPTTPGALFTAHQSIANNDGSGYYDAFVTKLDTSGGLAYSAFLGGSRTDGAEAIAVDASGSAYVTGGTASLNFPVGNTVTSYGLGGDGFITKLNAAGSAVIYSGYIHGADSAYDTGSSIAVTSGYAEVVGVTDSASFPLVAATQGTRGGSRDAFVSEFNTNSAGPGSVTFSTYLGGASDETSVAVAVGPTGLHVAGTTSSTNFPTTTGAYEVSSNGSSDIFAQLILPGTPRPDLIVTSFTAPATFQPGQTASYTWTIKNVGTATAVAGALFWDDQVWLSGSPTSISGAAGAGGIVAVRSLAPGDSYTRTFSATMPNLPPGKYYFVLQTDSNANVAESDETNNLFAVPTVVPYTIGQVAPAQPNPGSQCTTCSLFQGATDPASPAYAAPADGTITSWSVQGPSDVCTGCSVRLRIFRETASGVFMTVAETDVKTVGTGLQTWPAAIAVRAGDLLGIEGTNGIRWYTGLGADRIKFIQGDPSAGSVTPGECPQAGSLCWFYDPNGDGARVNVAATLVEGAAIGGSVLDESGAPVADVAVQAYLSSVGSLAGQATTDEGGAYRISLPPGSYRVTFTPPAGSQLARQTYSDKISAIGATDVTITTVDVTGIDATLHPVYAVSGRVFDASGGSLAGVSVQIYDGVACCAPVGETTTNADGYYTFDLAAGYDYRMRARTAAGDELWWNQKANPGETTQAGWTVATPFRMETTSYTCADVVWTALLDNWNTDAVTGGGRAPSFTTPGGGPYCVNWIATYHYNTGDGVSPGTVTLDGPTTLGPLAMTGTNADGLVQPPFVNWVVTPDSGSVIQGTYRCVDSDPATWSQNTASGGDGFCKVYGVPATAYTTPAARPNMNFIIGGSTLSGIAKCGTTVLPLAKVELLSGTSVVATTFAVEDGGFAFLGVAADAAFGLRYTSADGKTVCGAEATTSDGSVIVPDNTVPNLLNSTWLTAYPLQYDGSDGFPVQDYIATPRDAWFKFSIAPSEQVIVSLRDCQFDCSLVLFTDIQQAAGTLQAGTLAAVQQTQRAIAPAELSPAELSPAELSPAELSPAELSPAELSPAELSPAELSPAELSPAELSPAELSPAELSPAELSAAAYSSAQTASLLAISAHAGLSPELIVRNTWEHTGNFYVRVLSHDGTTSQQPFTISARAIPGACANVPLAPIASSIAAGVGTTSTPTLYLTNSSRLVNAPATATAPAMTVAQFMTRLNAFATLHGGTVVDFAGDSGVTAGLAILDAHTDCALAANTVADTINDVVQAYRANGGLQYIVIAGGDRAIPFRRVPDLSGLGTEDSYHVPVLDSSVSNAALKSRFFLSQDFYAAPFPIVRGNLRVYLPQEGIGRLVESPRDMAAMLDAFDLVNGLTAPKTALSTGYDFIADLADDLTNTFTSEGFTTVDTLVEASGLGPDHATAWTADDLRAKLFGPTPYGVYAINGHFAGNLALAADYKTLLGSEEVANLPASDLRFLNALILSMGCHAGYSIVDQDGVPDLTQTVAWAEAWNGRGATVVGGTGYGYADTDFVQYSEKILSNTAKALGIGASPVAIGDALVSAKSAYLTALAAPEGIDVKAASEATLYGLPMMKYAVTRPGTTSGGTPLSLTSGESGGLQYGTPVLSYALNLHTDTVPLSTSNTTVDLSYYDASGDIQVTPLQPILPRNVTRLSIPATTVLRGGALYSAQYEEVSPILPRTDVATIEERGELPTAFASVYTPLRLFSINQIGDDPSLVVLPLQYLTDGDTGTARKYDAAHLNIRLYTSTRTDASALADAPSITSVVLTRTATGVHVDALLGGLIGAGLEDVLFTYTTGADPTTHIGTWSSITLRANDLGIDRVIDNGIGYSEHVSGDITTGSPDDVRLFVQAVSGNALVSVASNTGAYYRLEPDTNATPEAPKHESALGFTSAPPSSVAYGATVSATVRLTDDGTGVDGKKIDFNFGGHHVKAVTSGGGFASANFVASFSPSGSPYLFTVAFKEDPTLLGSQLAPNVTITQGTSELSATATPASAQYSDASTLAATLTGGGTGLNSELVTVAIKSGATTVAQRLTLTDASGVARFDVRSFTELAPGAYTATFTFGGNGSYDGSTSAPLDFTRTLEDGSIAITPPGPQPASSVTVQAIVTQAADGSLGDLRKATATFTFQPETGAATVRTVAVAVDGTASLTLALPAGVYTVSATVGGWFTSGPATATLLMPVYDPSTFGTGGGWAVTAATTPAGTTALPLGKKANFGFNVKYKDGTTTPTGSLLFQLKEAAIDLKATGFDWLVINGGRAEFQGTATINGSGGYSFRVIATQGSATVADRFEIRIWSAGGSFDAPKYVVSNTVGGGSIKVH